MKTATKNTLDFIATTVVAYAVCSFIGQKMGEGWLRRVDKRSQKDEDESVKRAVSGESDVASSETL